MSAMGVQVLREVRLYGPLRARFGRSHWLAVDSPSEAVHALATMLQGFREAVLGHHGPGYRVLVGEGQTADHRGEETLAMRAGPSAVIRIAPAMSGRKRGGLGMIVAGIALMVVAPYAASALFSAMGGVAGGMAAATATSLVYSGAMGLGKALILGGVIQLVSPQRTGSASTAEQESSYALGGAVNITSPGAAVPLIIGRMVVGSVVVSAGLSTDDIDQVATVVNAPPALPAEEPAIVYATDAREYG